jgi:hypothetical protein
VAYMPFLNVTKSCMKEVFLKHMNIKSLLYKPQRFQPAGLNLYLQSAALNESHLLLYLPIYLFIYSSCLQVYSVSIYCVFFDDALLCKCGPVRIFENGVNESKFDQGEYEEDFEFR